MSLGSSKACSPSLRKKQSVMIKEPEFMTYSQWLCENPAMAELEPEVCKACESGGKVCPDCGGTGNHKCPTCGEEVSCDTCRGEGTFDCSDCNGTGEIDIARKVYDEQRKRDEEKLKSFVLFYKQVTGKELVLKNNT